MTKLYGRRTAPIPLGGFKEAILRDGWSRSWEIFGQGVDVLTKGKLPRPNESLALIRAAAARKKHKVDGTGTTVAVIDSGCRTDHTPFEDKNKETRILRGIHFKENGSPDHDTSDKLGHGTAVSGIIAGSKIPGGIIFSDYHVGIAHGAKVFPVKIMDDEPSTDFALLEEALRWLDDKQNRKKHDISVIHVSVGDDLNYSKTDDIGPGLHDIQREIGNLVSNLHRESIPVVVATGNLYAKFDPEVGMCLPAIFPKCISVGAIFTGAQKDRIKYNQYADAEAIHPKLDLVTPFSQRLPHTADNEHRMTMVAPGAPIEGLWHKSKNQTEPKLAGTSLAAPMVTGVIALMQEKFRNTFGVDQLPSINQIKKWLRDGAAEVTDIPGKHDNVTNTGEKFKRLDALGALNAMDVPDVTG